MGLVQGTPFVGLPGNPVAAYVTLLFVVRPLLRGSVEKILVRH